MAKRKEYTNGEITVVWKPELCIHSAKCVHGLPEVFKPKEKPWIQMENSQTKEIKETVESCPSGAISYFMNAAETVDLETGKPSGVTKVEVVEKGPLMVHGSLQLTHSDGREETKERLTAFCRCGASANKPFCDGSHKQHVWK